MVCLREIINKQTSKHKEPPMRGGEKDEVPTRRFATSNKDMCLDKNTS